MAADRLNGLRPAVGLEIHVRLRAPTKLFCGCRNDAHAAPNTLICPVCMGLPGSLPVLSAEAVLLGARMALALGARVAQVSRFDRKHYFYPDLPRNYQITQKQAPLAVGGSLAVGDLTMPLERMHLEEDAGRLLAGPRPGSVAVDLNRAGVPLLEIVTRPVPADGAGIRAWLRELRRLVRWLGVGDGSLEDGSLRCDANVGFVAPAGRDDPAAAAWSELKNLNSPGAVQRAVDFEIRRLTAAVRRGDALVAETRSWDAAAGRTALLRRKEETRDYRFLAEPDLPPAELTAQRLAALTEVLPELPWERRARFGREYGLHDEVLATLCRDRALGDYFEAVARAARAAEPPLAANWIATEVAGRWDSDQLEPTPCPLPAEGLAALLDLKATGRLSGPAVKRVFAALWEDPDRKPATVAAALGLLDTGGAVQLERWCAKAVAGSEAAVAAWRAGKTGALDHLVGRVMALSGGRADPVAARVALRAILEKRE